MVVFSQISTAEIPTLGDRMKPTYQLDDFETSNYGLVNEIVVNIHRELFPEDNADCFAATFKDIAGMFAGNYKEFQAMDTKYHDLEHTLQSTLCWIRLMANRHKQKIEPLMTPEEFKIGFLGILMHDVGYLKEKVDNEGTGAKFTFVHERRSCEFADVYLDECGWGKRAIFSVQHLISCTGPRSLIDTIPFFNELERIMGEAVCTADYIGQMSDPKYIQKLPALFAEFEESDDYRGVPPEDRIFKSYDELLRGTPFFWESIVIPKLDTDCHGLYNFLGEPYPDGQNPYIEKIEENVEIVKEMLGISA